MKRKITKRNYAKKTKLCEKVDLNRIKEHCWHFFLQFSSSKRNKFRKYGSKTKFLRNFSALEWFVTNFDKNFQLRNDSQQISTKIFSFGMIRNKFRRKFSALEWFVTKFRYSVVPNSDSERNSKVFCFAKQAEFRWNSGPFRLDPSFAE